VLKVTLPATQISNPSKTLLQRPSGFVNVQKANPPTQSQLSSTAPLTNASRILTTIILISILVIVGVQYGDYTRHLVDHLQCVWLLGYIGMGEGVIADAWVRGFSGAVFGAFRFGHVYTPLPYRFGLV
jgi:hypothetical protein